MSSNNGIVARGSANEWHKFLARIRHLSRSLLVFQIFHCIASAGSVARNGLAVADGAEIRDQIEHGLFEGSRRTTHHGEEDLYLAKDGKQPHRKCRVVDQLALADGDKAQAREDG